MKEPLPPKGPNDLGIVGSIRPEVLEALETHGVRPAGPLDPHLLRDFLNRLYVLQISDLRIKRKELEAFFGPQPLDQYKADVEALSSRYSILAIPPEEWFV